MRSKSLAIILAVVFCASMVFSQLPSMAAQQEAAAQQQYQMWEYDFIQCDIANPGRINKDLNQKGRQGWEVCGTLLDGSKPTVVLLKRPMWDNNEAPRL